MIPVPVCGPCAARVVEGGGSRVEGGQIELGTECEECRLVHASSLVRLPDGWSRQRETVPELAAELEGLPPELGPRTRVALELLSAWSASRGYADTTMVRASVGVADELLRLTKGA